MILSQNMSAYMFNYAVKVIRYTPLQRITFINIRQDLPAMHDV